MRGCSTGMSVRRKSICLEFIVFICIDKNLKIKPACLGKYQNNLVLCNIKELLEID